MVIYLTERKIAVRFLLRTTILLRAILKHKDLPLNCSNFSCSFLRANLRPSKTSAGAIEVATIDELLSTSPVMSSRILFRLLLVYAVAFTRLKIATSLLVSFKKFKSCLYTQSYGRSCKK